MRFYPNDAPVPDELRTSAFVARPLRPATANPDYDAYMACPETMRVHSGGHRATENYSREGRRVT
ncbi:MAG TPA: hypothetical protein VER55_13545 [Ardenticatenaceae bacterium]|nr:hypothetical protein [Ardenticatenaceae bacterium]